MELGDNVLSFRGDPGVIVTLYRKGKLTYIEAHRLILECCDCQALRIWSVELVKASEIVAAALILALPVVVVPIKARKRNSGSV